MEGHAEEPADPEQHTSVLRLGMKSLQQIPTQQLTIHLRELYLHNNNLTTLPQCLFDDAPGLVRLDLSWNQLSSIPIEIGSLTQLEHLNLSFNIPLTQLPSSIGLLSQLRSFAVTDCGLRTVPVELANLPLLQQCELQFNSVRELPTDFLLHMRCEPMLTGNPCCGQFEALATNVEPVAAVEIEPVAAVERSNVLRVHYTDTVSVMEDLKRVIEETRQVGRRSLHTQQEQQTAVTQLEQQQQEFNRLQETLAKEGASLHQKQQRAQRLGQSMQFEQTLHEARQRAVEHHTAQLAAAIQAAANCAGRGNEATDSAEISTHDEDGADEYTAKDVATVRAMLLERAPGPGPALDSFDSTFQHEGSRRRPSFTLTLPSRTTAASIKRGTDGAPAASLASPSSLPSLRAGVSCPKHFLCPITHEVFLEPVVACDGFTYEKDAIKQWLSRRSCDATASRSPMTGESLACERLVPNHLVRAMVVDFFEANREGINENK